MGKKKKVIFGFLFLFLLGLLSGCGQKEYIVEFGVDGYVYPARRLKDLENVEDMRVIGDYLYYMQDLDNKTVVGRVSVASLAAGEGEMDFSKRKILAEFRNITFVLPEGAGDGGEEIDFVSALNGGMRPGNVVDPDKRYGRLMLSNYAVSPDGTIYFYLTAYAGEYFAMETMGGVLCRQSAEGEQIYQVYLPEVLDFAVDAQGRGIVLTGKGIEVLDQDGNQISFLSTEGYRQEEKGVRDKLFTDSENRVYYSTVNARYVRTTFEIVGEEGFRLENVGNMLGDGFQNCSPAPEGNIYLFASDSEGILYLYDRKTGSKRTLLNWCESGLTSGGVRSVAGVTPDILLVSFDGIWGGKSGIYQLTKTSVEDLPQKELLVIASPVNSFELQKAVMLFNADSDTYRVVLDSYGAEFLDEEGYVCRQLDAGLVSANPPDILNLDWLDIEKYAKKGVLEDLTPYMEGSSLDREDILDNVLEALTFDGKLVSVPSEISIDFLKARASQMADFDSWTMEDVYRMAEQHPDKIGKLVEDGFCKWQKRDWMLEEFCSHYYLEKFVDWEKGECSFDSEEFRSLIAWVGKYGWEPGQAEQQMGHSFEYDGYYSEDVLMVSGYSISFTSLMEFELQLQDEACLKGYPSVDGAEFFSGKTSGKLGINANSTHKEAAWEFMEFYWQICAEESARWGYPPISKSKLEKRYENMTTITYIEGARTMEGEPAIKEKGIVSAPDGSLVHFNSIDKDQGDAILNVIKTADFSPLSEKEKMVIRIVLEEAEGYYQGDKSLEEVTRLIQNRVQLLLDEKKG